MNDSAARLTSVWITIILLALAIAPFAQTRTFEFVNYDDNLYVTENRIVQQGLTREGLVYAFTTFEGGNWHPLTWLSHMLDCQLFRQDDGSQWAGGHHMMNVALHALNTLLVWIVLRRMTACNKRSALVAALFAVHPLHVESVAWVSERKDLLSTMLGLLAMWLYVGFAARGGAGRYFGMLALFALSLLAKPMLVTLPFLLLLLDAWPLQRWRVLGVWGESTRAPKPLGALVLEKIPLLALTIAFSVMALRSQSAYRTVSDLEAIPLFNRLANAAVAYVEYLQKLIIPTDLAMFYPHPGSWPTARVAMSLIVLVVVTAMAVMQRRQRPWLLIGWVWFLGTLIPVIGLVQVGLQAMADRYTYVPAIGIFIMFAWSVPSLKGNAAGVAWRLAAGVVIVGLAVMSFSQTSHWRNSRTLAERALKVTKDNFIAHQNLGNVLEREGRLDEALMHYQRAADLRPKYSRVRENVANVLLQQGRTGEALAQIEEAIRLEPRSFSAHNSLGIIMLTQQRYPEAVAALQTAVELDSNNLEARGNLGAALLQTGQYEQAAQHLRRVVQAHPQRVGVRTNLARALVGLGQKDQAMLELRNVLADRPNFAPAVALLLQLTSAAPPPTTIPAEPGPAPR